MRPNHLGEGGRRIQSQRFVGDGHRTIEVTGGGVRDGEHIKGVCLAAQGQDDRALGEADRFFGTPNRRVWRRGQK